MHDLLNNIHNCSICDTLPLGPRPVVQLSRDSKIVIIGQAPGRKVHETGIPWNDKSGDTLRKWLDVTEETFYNPLNFSIMGMGFCYPGKGVSGDLPPRPECSRLWHPQIITSFVNKPLVLLIGQYAQRYYLDNKLSLTDTVRNFKEYLPDYFVLPHPSPRNQNWVKVNPWFINEVIPHLRTEIKERLFI
jgi:uracil-DNA glycosylase